MGDGITPWKRKFCLKNRWLPRYGEALQNALHTNHVVFLNILFSTITSTLVLKGLSDHWVTGCYRKERYRKNPSRKSSWYIDVTYYCLQTRQQRNSVPGHAILVTFARVRIHSAVRYSRYNTIFSSQVWYLRGNVSQKESQFFGLSSSKQLHDSSLISEFSHPHLAWTHEYLERYKILLKNQTEKETKFNSIKFMFRFEKGLLVSTSNSLSVTSANLF